MIKISKRLETIASLVKKDANLIDIGCDHAILPIYLIENNIASNVIASDVSKGPIDVANKNIKFSMLDDKIETRLGSGLATVEPNEIDTVVIAGMGGTLIKDILESGKDKLINVNRLILQPNINEYAVRLWIQNNGFYIVDEIILDENEKVYEIIVAEKGNVKYSEKELYFGPILSDIKSELFIKKHNDELSKLKRILSQIPSDNIDKTREFKNKINLYEDILS